jgi:ABC-type bacteriocin/lantibiotic exporter with double-glycine peptidase domain
MLLFVSILFASQSALMQPPVLAQAATVLPQIAIAGNTVPDVPFYSQFTDISSASWRGKGCGITSLAMVIGYYKQSPISVDNLLAQGIAANAYESDAGWTYNGLIKVAQEYGMSGVAYDLSSSKTSVAYAQFESALKSGPIIASIHYKFDPKSTIPHLVVIDSIQNNIVYYNDPAAKSGEKQVSVDTFLSAWKKRYIIIRPKPGSTQSILA